MKSEQWFPKVGIIVLALILVFTLVISFGVNIAPFFDPSSKVGILLNITTWAPPKPLEHLPALTLSSAALIAILTFKRERDKSDLENKRSRSEFFFRQASQGLDEVYDLLRDQNNDRVIWIRAARSLIEAKKLGGDIELKELQRAYRLYEQRMMRFTTYYAIKTMTE